MSTRGLSLSDVLSHVLNEQYIVDATDNAATNLKWTSTTAQEYTVPAGKRWFLFGGQITRDVATGTATVEVDIYNDADKPVLHLDTRANGTGTTPYPVSTYTGSTVWPFPMDAGWYVKILIGEAQDAAAAATCCVIEVPISILG